MLVILLPSLPKSSSHTLWGSVWKDPLKTEPQEVFVGPNTDPHKVFGRVGSDDMHEKITDPLPSALKTWTPGDFLTNEKNIKSADVIV